MEQIERFIRDIVEVRYYRASECILPMPSNLTFPVRTMENCGFKTALCVLALGDDITPLDQSATLRQVQSRKESGKITSHTLTATIKDNVSEAIKALEYPVSEDIYVVYKTEDGHYYLLYSLPSASEVTTEVNDATEHTITVNYSCKSNYQAVLLTTPVFS